MLDIKCAIQTQLIDKGYLQDGDQQTYRQPIDDTIDRVLVIDRQVGSTSFLVLCGVSIREIDRKVSLALSSLGYKLEDYGLPTVFVRGDETSKDFRGKRIDTRVLSDNSGDGLLASCYNFNQQFIDINSIAHFCLENRQLSIGHHALRIPIILAMAGLPEKSEQYIDWVLDDGFVTIFPDYIRALGLRGLR